MPSDSDFSPPKINFGRDPDSLSVPKLRLELDEESLPVTGLSAHGFDIAPTPSLLGSNGICEGSLRSDSQSDPIPVKFRARQIGQEAIRCTLVDLSLDHQDAIETLVEKQDVDAPSEFDDLSYDQLAKGGKPSNAKSEGSKPAKSESKTERRGAIAAIVCAVGFTAALMVVGSIALGRNSLDVYNGALVGNYLPMSSAEDGTIAKIFVTSGDRVVKGTPLFRMYSPEQAQQMETLQTDLARAVDEFDAQDRQLQSYARRLDISTRAVEKDIEIAKAELAQVQVDLKHAKALAANLAPLLRSKAISKIEYQAAVAAHESLAQQVLVKNATVDRLKVSLDAIVSDRITVGSGGQLDDRANQLAMDRELAEAAVKEARRKIEFHNLQLADQTVLAAEPGIVYSTYRTMGEFVKAGEPVVSLSLIETNWAIGHITPDDALRARPGQKVYVSIPSLNLETEGTIASIGHRGVYSAGNGWSNDFRSDPVNIPIKINLPKETSELPSGLRLKMSVALERRWPWESKVVDFSPTTPAPVSTDEQSVIATKH